METQHPQTEATSSRGRNEPTEKAASDRADKETNEPARKHVQRSRPNSEQKPWRKPASQRSIKIQTIIPMLCTNRKRHPNNANTYPLNCSGKLSKGSTARTRTLRRIALAHVTAGANKNLVDQLGHNHDKKRLMDQLTVLIVAAQARVVQVHPCCCKSSRALAYGVELTTWRREPGPTR
jgi:hypothetical protein